jgi:hypothetical protein
MSVTSSGWSGDPPRIVRPDPDAPPGEVEYQIRPAVAVQIGGGQVRRTLRVQLGPGRRRPGRTRAQPHTTPRSEVEGDVGQRLDDPHRREHLPFGETRGVADRAGDLTANPGHRPSGKLLGEAHAIVGQRTDRHGAAIAEAQGAPVRLIWSCRMARAIVRGVFHVSWIQAPASSSVVATRSAGRSDSRRPRRRRRSPPSALRGDRPPRSCGGRWHGGPGSSSRTRSRSRRARLRRLTHRNRRQTGCARRPTLSIAQALAP